MTGFDDREARAWIEMIEGPGASVRDGDLYPAVAGWLETSGARRVLEIGCGQGACSARVPLEGRRYVGVEPSGLLASRAQELHAAPNRSFVRGDAYRLPFITNSFDAAFSIAVWHLLADLRRACTELARVLRPVGKALIITAHPEARDAWTRAAPGERLHLHPLDALRLELESAGFDDLAFAPLRATTEAPSGLFVAASGTRVR